MESTSPQTLHDSLDLSALRAEIASINRLQTRRRALTRYYYVGLALVFGLVIFGVMGRSASRTLALNTLDLARLALIGCMVIYFGPILSAFQQHRAFAKRFNIYAPNIVPRTTLWDVLRVISGYGILVVAGLVGIFLPIQYSLPFFPLLITWLVWIYGYRRFLAWTYRGGLERLNQALRFLPGNYYLTGNRAVYLMNSGQVEEAAQIFLALIKRRSRRDIYTIPIWMNNLGLCYTFIGRYPDGLAMLESAIRISPGLGHAYDSLATWYLDQKRDAERAVELTEIALELANPQDTSSTTIRQATSAYALALVGKHTRADALIAQVMQSIPALDRLPCAEANRQLGYARLAQGKREAAVQHFERAIELDPEGLFGKLAQKALDSIPPSA